MTHQIISNLPQLLAFIDWLPDLLPGEYFYMALMGRRKYYAPLANIKSDNEQLARFLCTKSNMVEKIKQLEVHVGSYTRQGIVIPDEALALYINPNPRSSAKARDLMLQECLKATLNHNDFFRADQVALSCYHKKSSARKCVVDFDIDGEVVQTNFIEQVWANYINRESVKFLFTRGGVHVLVKPALVSPDYQRTWYRKLSEMAGVDKFGDMEMPVPGCFQGGYVPILV